MSQATTLEAMPQDGAGNPQSGRPDSLPERPVEERVGPDEYVGIFVFFCLCGLIWLRFETSNIPGPAWLPYVAAFVGFVASDFFSGLVHWGFDTWGAPTTPIVGEAFLIPFREHHVDQKEITRHGFVETNGNNCLITIPVLGGSFLIPCDVWWGAAAVMAILWLCVGTFGTNQFHKWAHSDNPHALIRLAQRVGLILSPEHHAVHHSAPYCKHYCITTGWLNPLLDRVQFYRHAERLITWMTGVQPRADDLKNAVRQS